MYLLFKRWKATSETDLLALGRNIFNSNNLAKKVKTLLVLFY
jgi:hypothetical protein